MKTIPHTFPGGEVSSLEQRVLKNTFHTTECCDNINTVIVQLPQLSIMPLRGPPERIAVNAVGVKFS